VATAFLLEMPPEKESSLSLDGEDGARFGSPFPLPVKEELCHDKPRQADVGVGVRIGVLSRKKRTETTTPHANMTRDDE